MKVAVVVPCRVFMVDEEKCNGCLLCALACSIAHTGTTDIGRSRIRVITTRDGHKYAPLTCQHCETAICTQVCPTTACHRDQETCTVLIDERRCIGCKSCIVACPFGAPRYDAAAGVSVKCDLCEGDPQCVRYCEATAISYVHSDESSLERRREAAAGLARRLPLPRKERSG